MYVHWASLGIASLVLSLRDRHRPVSLARIRLACCRLVFFFLSVSLLSLLLLALASIGPPFPFLLHLFFPFPIPHQLYGLFLRSTSSKDKGDGFPKNAESMDFRTKNDVIPSPCSSSPLSATRLEVFDISALLLE